jgi:hypothetical protein
MQWQHDHVAVRNACVALDRFHHLVWFCMCTCCDVWVLCCVCAVSVAAEHWLENDTTKQTCYNIHYNTPLTLLMSSQPAQKMRIAPGGA